MIEIEVPCVSCFAHELMATPFSTDERMAYLKALHKQGGLLPFPIIKKVGDRFKVVYGWDVVNFLLSCGMPRVRALLLGEGDSELSWCITKHAEEIGLTWIDVAQAYAKAKQVLNVSDVTIANEVGIDRSKVTKMIKIASKLNPKLIKLAQQNVFTYSECRRLVTLSMSNQDEFAERVLEKPWLSKSLFNKLFPQKTNSPTLADTTSTKDIVKSTDLKRLEINISEQIGYPFNIQLHEESGKAGTIEYQFFDRRGMIDVLSKLRAGFVGDANVRGKIVLSFESLDEFESLTGNFGAN